VIQATSDEMRDELGLPGLYKRLLSEYACVWREVRWMGPPDYRRHFKNPKGELMRPSIRRLRLP